MLRLVIVVVAIGCLAAACARSAEPAPTATVTAIPPTQSPSPANNTSTATPTPASKLTPIPIQSFTPTPMSAPTPSEETPKETPISVNRIAYIGVDGDLYVINPDGSGSHRLPGGVPDHTARLTADEGHVQGSSVFHAWPTWSPDGSRLAVSRVTIGNPASITAEVYSITTANGSFTKLYEDPPNVIPLIAENTPHYMYWSPDSRHLTFIANRPDGLALFISSEDVPEELGLVVRGAPLYWAWAANSLSILLHVAGDLLLLDFTDSEGPIQLGNDSIAFRAPAFSPESGSLAYIDRSKQGGNVLVVADADGANGREVVDVGEDSAFLWSPTQNRIALIDSGDPSNRYFDGLKVVDLENGMERTVTTESVVSFFWSPNGERIAYVAFDPTARRLSWNVVNPDQGPPQKLVDFIPSEDLSLLLAFFDQYAYSNSVWSPDSRHLVFTGQLVPTGTGSNGGMSGDQVYILDVDGSSVPRAIAEGTTAFWSWS